MYEVYTFKIYLLLVYVGRDIRVVELREKFRIPVGSARQDEQINKDREIYIPGMLLILFRFYDEDSLEFYSYIFSCYILYYVFVYQDSPFRICLLLVYAGVPMEEELKEHPLGLGSSKGENLAQPLYEIPIPGMLLIFVLGFACDESYLEFYVYIVLSTFHTYILCSKTLPLEYIYFWLM